MFEADRSRDEFLQDLRTCLEGTNLEVAARDVPGADEVRFRFGVQQYRPVSPPSYFGLPNEFTAKGRGEARAFAVGVRTTRTRGVEV